MNSLASPADAATAVATDPSAELADALLSAAAAGDRARVDALLVEGAPLDAVDARGRSAALLAALGHHLDLLGHLVRRGIDADRQDRTCLNPFLLGCITGDLPLVELMLGAGTDLSRVTRFGGVGIHPAAEKGHVEVVRRLVRTDINVDHTNWLGWTPLLEAIVLRDGGPAQQEVVRLLLDAGASPHLTDKYGRTPLELAKDKGYDEIVALLVDAGA